MTNLFIPGKLDYIRGDRRPDVPCILCAVRDGHASVRDLTVHGTDQFLVSLNLYPYNPGHLFVFPRRHVTDVRQLDEREAREADRMRNLCIDVLESIYRPSGFNFGYNQGKTAGASIEHIHQHVIPRYPHELGLSDLIGGARVIVEDPLVTRDKLRQAFDERARAAAGKG